MNIDPERELSAHTVEIIQALLASAPEPERFEVTDIALARFICGWADEDEEEAVITELSQSGELRERLIAQRQELKEISSQPFAASSDRTGPIVEVLREVVRSSLGIYGRLRETIEKLGWSELASAAGDEAKAARAALAAVGEAISRRPRLAAEFRSTTTSSNRILPDGPEYTLTFTSEPEGLAVTARIPGWQSVQGQTIYLSLVGGDTSVLLAKDNLTGETWTAIVPTFSALFRIDADQLQPSMFLLSLEPDSGSPSRIEAQIGGETVSLQLVRAPSVVDNMLTLEVVIPTWLRNERPTAVLQLWLALGGASLIIGVWQISELAEPSSRLTAPIPGAVDGDLEYLSVLRLVLQE